MLKLGLAALVVLAFIAVQLLAMTYLGPDDAAQKAALISWGR